MNLITGWLVRGLPWIPRGIIRRVAWRYIAGETREDLLRVATSLHGAGFLTTVDVLGENVRAEDDVRRATEEYLALIEDLSRLGLASEVSVKSTMLGLRLSEDVATAAIERIVAHAEKLGIGVTLDMEDATTTDAILRIFRRLRERHSHLGVAIQAYLERSVSDVEALLSLRPAVRVCKGIYVEPPGTTLTDRQAIRESYMRLVTLLLEGGGYPAIATHDPWLVDRCLGLLAARGRRRDDHEFQMLLGVGEHLRPRILAAGSRIRLYCPYGSDWYRYSLRRLQENPRIALYVLRAVLSRRGSRQPRASS